GAGGGASIAAPVWSIGAGPSAGSAAGTSCASTGLSGGGVELVHAATPVAVSAASVARNCWNESEWNIKCLLCLLSSPERPVFRVAGTQPMDAAPWGAPRRAQAYANSPETARGSVG